MLYVLTKSIDIPCPAYKISQISQTQAPPTASPKQVQEESQIPKQASEATGEPVEIRSAQASSEQSPAQTSPEQSSEQSPAQTSPEQSSEQSPAQENSDVLDELEKLVEEQNVSSI